MSWVAVAVAGAAVVGSVASSRASSSAARSSQRGTDASINEQARQYDQTRQDFGQQRAIGGGATSLLSRLYGISTPGTPGEFDSQAYLAANPDVAASDWFRGNPEAHYQQYGQAEGRQAVYNGATPATQGGAPDMTAFTESPDYQFNLQQGQQAIDRSLAARGRTLSGAGVKEGVRYASGLASGQYSDYTNRLMQIAGLGSAATSATAGAGANMANANSQALLANGQNRANLTMQNSANINNQIQGGISNYMLQRYLGQQPPVAMTGN